MHISRICIQNFRNFSNLDVALSTDVVIVGENKIGKSNLLFALRLLLDPSLPDSSRQLREEDFWDGIPRPLAEDTVISILIEFADFEDDERLLATLGDFLISGEPMVARLTYVFGKFAAESASAAESDYDFFIFAGESQDNRVGGEFRRRLPLDLLPALRDAEGDLANWRRSPLRPLLDEVSAKIDKDTLAAIAQQVSEATEGVVETEEIQSLATEITTRLTNMVGEAHALEMAFGFSPTEADRLVRSLRLFIDGGKRGVADASLGSANLLYLTLKALELDQLVSKRKRDHTFLAIEEPEAHLHPHLQRLVYRDFLNRRVHQESEAEHVPPRLSTSIFMTTHSPHIVSVSPLNSLVLLRKASGGDSEAVSTAALYMDEADRSDLERYLDVTRGEMLFAKAVLLVEGEAETYVVPTLARLLGFDFDQLGITVCSVAGTNFLPYIKLLGANGLNIPFAVLTDLDPHKSGANLGEERVLKLLPHLVKVETIQEMSPSDQLALAKSNGIFLNEHTLEVDLFKCGRQVSIRKTICELTEAKVAKVRVIAWANDPTSLDTTRFLADIEDIGKGRFAQRLAGNMKNDSCPSYIQEAIRYVVEKIV